MKKNNRNNRKLNIKSQEIIMDVSDISKRNGKSWWTLALISTLSAFCICMGFYSGFNIEINLITTLVLTVLYSFTLQWILSEHSRIKVGLPVVIGTLIVYILITISQFINGFTGIVNRVISTVNETMAQAHLKYVVSEKSLSIDQYLATIAVCIIVTILFNILLRYGHSFLCAILLLGSTMINMIYKGKSQTIWIALALVCLFEVFYFSNICIAKIKKSAITGCIFAGVLAVISALFIMFADYTRNEYVDNLKDEIIYHGGNIVYGKSDYPEGQFKRFDKLSVGDENVRLTVTMSTPVDMHLKGYVGCRYTENGWKGNEEKIYGGDYQGMIDWFMSKGYYPLMQPAYYMEYSVKHGMNASEIEESSIHIKNNSASKKYEYVPEGLLNMSGLISPKQDVNFIEQDLFGEDDYWFEMVYYNDDYLKFPTQNWFENEDEEKDFIEAESVYHSFAGTYYMEVPDEEKAILKANVPQCNNNILDAVSTVRRYLKQQIEYSEECAAYGSSKNFLQQTLLEDKRGYSAHFATVATLMFRYYGIPARYVEGYYFANEEKQDAVNVMDTDAHAWVEVYIKGLGFVPIEVTPGFYKDDSLGSDNSQQKEQEQKNNSGGSSGTKKDEDKKLETIDWHKILMYVLIIVSIILLISINILIIRRFIIVSARKRKLKSDNIYKVVGVSSAYGDDVCKFAGLHIRNEIPENVCTVLEKIKFSNHMLRADEKDMVVDCMNKLVNRIWKTLPIHKKIKMMFWNCLR